MKTKEILSKLRSIELCMTAHPDFEKGSEFEDRVLDLQSIQKSLDVTDLKKMDAKIKEVLEQLYAIKDDDKFYFDTYGMDFIKEIVAEQLYEKNNNSKNRNT